MHDILFLMASGFYLAFGVCVFVGLALLWVQPALALAGLACTGLALWTRRMRGIPLRWSFRGLSRERRMRGVRAYIAIALMMFVMAGAWYAFHSSIAALPVAVMGLFFAALALLAWRGQGGERHD